MSQQSNRIRKNESSPSDYYEYNEFNHTVNDHDVRPPNNEAYLYSPRYYNNKLIIQSRFRNRDKYPDQALYTVELEREYRMVLSVELVQAIVPFSGYTINKNNQILHIQESFDEIIQIIMPPGNYTADELATVLETELNNVGESVFTVTVLDKLNKLKIASDLSGGDNFLKLLFAGDKKHNINDLTTERQYRCQSIGEIIGFPPINTTFIIGKVSAMGGSDCVLGIGTKFLTMLMNGDKVRFEDDPNVYTVTDIISDEKMKIFPNKVGNSKFVNMAPGSFIGPNALNLEPTKFIALFINQEDTEPMNRVISNNGNIQDAFCIIPKFPLLTSLDGTTFITSATLPRVNNIFHFHPLAQKLNKMTIKFTDENGDLYDFNGREHTLEFNVRTLNDIGN